MELHSGEIVVFEGHPSWRAILSFYLKGLVALLVVAAVAAAATAIGGSLDVPIVVLAALVTLVVVLVAGFVLRRSTTFTITNQRLHIRRGILARREQQTRLERVQNVNTSQSPIERLLRVGRVEFDTAGSDDFEFAFGGVDDPSGVVEAVNRAQREFEASAHTDVAGAADAAAAAPAPPAPAADDRPPVAPPRDGEL